MTPGAIDSAPEGLSAREASEQVNKQCHPGILQQALLATVESRLPGLQVLRFFWDLASLERVSKSLWAFEREAGSV